MLQPDEHQYLRTNVLKIDSQVANKVTNSQDGGVSNLARRTHVFLESITLVKYAASLAQLASDGRLFCPTMRRFLHFVFHGNCSCSSPIREHKKHQNAEVLFQPWPIVLMAQKIVSTRRKHI